jgi:nucleotide-binding universal stress UspA family protein
MTTPERPDDQPTQLRIVVGYDGSIGAATAINAGAALFPRAHAWIALLWTPSFADEDVRRRVWAGTRAVDAFIEAIERESESMADRVAASGVTLARAAGWSAEPLLHETLGGEGLEFTRLAEQTDADLVLVGSRGLTGAPAVLGSVSDMVVHYTPRPVVVVPHPMLRAEYDALAGGPVLIGWDGSAGARHALAEAARLFPTRELLAISVADDDDPVEDSVELSAGSGRMVSLRRVKPGRGGRGRGVADALAGVARRHRAAAIVVGSRGRSAAEEIMLGSTAMAVLHHAHRAVAVIPTPIR